MFIFWKAGYAEGHHQIPRSMCTKQNVGPIYWSFYRDYIFNSIVYSGSTWKNWKVFPLSICFITLVIMSPGFPGYSIYKWVNQAHLAAKPVSKLMEPFNHHIAGWLHIPFIFPLHLHIFPFCRHQKSPCPSHLG